jgi:serine/threonine protein kinase
LYQLQEKIGAGNFSVVYMGLEKQGDKKQVAVKVIEKFKLTEGENEVIKRECSILELCHHPCIIKFKNKIESKTHIFIVTEYMSEGGLYSYVRRKGFLEEYEASLIMNQLIETVIYMNSLSLIHRDLKAENIMVHNY